MSPSCTLKTESCFTSCIPCIKKYTRHVLKIHTVCTKCVPNVFHLRLTLYRSEWEKQFIQQKSSFSLYIPTLLRKKPVFIGILRMYRAVCPYTYTVWGNFDVRVPTNQQSGRIVFDIIFNLSYNSLGNKSHL